METIFWAVFRSEKQKHDRNTYFKQEKSLADFQLWVESKRREIEEEVGGFCCLENMGVIEKILNSSEKNEA